MALSKTNCDTVIQVLITLQMFTSNKGRHKPVDHRKQKKAGLMIYKKWKELRYRCTVQQGEAILFLLKLKFQITHGEKKHTEIKNNSSGQTVGKIPLPGCHYVKYCQATDIFLKPHQHFVTFCLYQVPFCGTVIHYEDIGNFQWIVQYVPKLLFHKLWKSLSPALLVTTVRHSNMLTTCYTKTIKKFMYFIFFLTKCWQ